MSDPRPESKASAAEVVSLDERRLLPLYSQGDQAAFAELMTRYKAPVYSYLVRSGVKDAARDDLFQEIFLKIHRAAATYTPERPLKPWLFTIVANAVRTHYRRNRVEELVFGDHEASDHEPDAQAVTESRQTLAFLEQAIRELPFAQREVLILCALEGLELSTAATVLRMPVNTVKTQLRRARLSLTRLLVRRHARQKREVSR